LINAVLNKRHPAFVQRAESLLHLRRERLKTKGEQDDDEDFFTSRLPGLKNKDLQINLSCATFKHYLIFDF